MKTQQSKILNAKLEQLISNIKQYRLSSVIDCINTISARSKYYSLALPLQRCLKNIKLDVQEIDSYSSKISDRMVNPNYDLYVQCEKLIHIKHTFDNHQIQLLYHADV